jgi:hypothetical protein
MTISFSNRPLLYRVSVIDTDTFLKYGRLKNLLFISFLRARGTMDGFRPSRTRDNSDLFGLIFEKQLLLSKHRRNDKTNIEGLARRLNLAAAEPQT